MIDIIFGKKTNPNAIDAIVKQIKPMNITGTLYIGYPVFDIDEHSLLMDALLVTQEHGVVAFDLTTSNETEISIVCEYQDSLHRGLYKRFLAEKQLVTKRQLSFEIIIVSIRPEVNIDGDDALFSTPKDLEGFITQQQALSEAQFKLINATIQKTTVIKPTKKRTRVTNDYSAGATIKKIEKEIANLDKWQKQAAIESPEKPQRIRGLAGSGKTIILAMKAAYLHACFPDKKIIVTFQSRTLYQQFTRLIERFYFEHKQDEPDWDYLRILHAWGSNNESGLYSNICNQMGISPLTFFTAKNKYGQEQAFNGACLEALAYAEKVSIDPSIDFLLIDEAQDFPTAFFKLVYKFVTSPKHIVWAYDELQNLGNYTMPPPDDLFGKSSNGTPLVTLHNEEDRPQQDIMLPICYRNPPWTLTLALALGLGIYRKDGLVRMFSDPSVWNNIGFDLLEGTLELGASVKLNRSPDRTPNYFNDLINPETAIIHQCFDSSEAQAKWVATQIQRDITTDELDPEDILIVLPDPYTLSSDAATLMHELRKINIDSHIVGKDTSRDIVFVEKSVAITHIYRAKGNEAPMVYAMYANRYYAGIELGRKRNSLFTAITRTKAWLRITGIGPNMVELSAEIERSFENNFYLSFTYPTAEELSALENAYRDKTPPEKKELQEGFAKIKTIKAQLINGEISIEDIPEEIRDLFI